MRENRVSRGISILLSIVMFNIIMLNSDYSVLAKSENEVIQNDYKFKLNEEDNTAILIDYLGDNTSLKVPESIDVHGKAYKISRLEDGSFGMCNSIESIELPETIESFGNYVFYCCEALKDIKIPNGVKSIGNDEFWGCKNLVKVQIPESVYKIGEGAFAACNNLEYVNIPRAMERIENNTFCGTNIRQIDIPDGVKYIDYAAFADCKNLKKVHLPDELQWMGDMVFDECPKLESIEIPYKIQRLGIKCFYGCKNLKTLKINSNDFYYVGDMAFDECNNINNVIYSNSSNTQGIDEIIDLNNYYKVYMNYSNHTETQFVKKDEGNLIYDNNKYYLYNEELGIANNPAIDSDRTYDMMDKGNITNVNINNYNYAIDKIHKKACINKYLGNEKQVDIPINIKVNGEEYNVTKINDNAFSNSTETEVVRVKNSIKYISDNAFEGCSSLSNIILCNCKESEFRDNIYKKDRYYKEILDGDNYSEIQLVKKENGKIIIDTDKYDLYDGDKLVTSYDVHENYKYKLVNKNFIKQLVNSEYDITIKNADSTVTINKYLGEDVNVSVPKEFNVDGRGYKTTEINDDAFKENKTIQTLIIPDTISKIGKNAFELCSSLVNIRLKDTTDSSVFDNDSVDKDIYYAVVLDGDSYKEVQFVKKGDNELIFEDENYCLYDSTLNKVNNKIINEDIKYKVYPNVAKDFEYEIGCLNRVELTKYIGHSKNVNIPDKVVIDRKEHEITTIGDKAFSECEDVETVEMGSNILYIEQDAFISCIKLKNIKLSPNLIRISNCAFDCCTSLKNIELPKTLTSIDPATFRLCKSLESITIPENVDNIGNLAFSDCNSLKLVIMGDNVTSIGRNAFDSCGDLREIRLSKNLSYIGDEAFCGCYSLANISMFNIGSIGKDVFRSCSSLINIRILNPNIDRNYAKEFGLYDMNTIKLLGNKFNEVQIVKSNGKLIFEDNRYELYDENDCVFNGEIKGDKTYKIVPKFKECDINGDGSIDMVDLSIEASNYNKTSKEKDWNSKIDFNKDNICDIYDLQRILIYID